MSKFKSVLLAISLLVSPQLVNAEFKYWDPLDTASQPVLLSQMGLYINITPKEKNILPSANHYDVISPEWKDGAIIDRWVLVKQGNSIVFDLKNDYWNYPDSTVFIQNLSIDTVPGDPASRVLWETRILINKKELSDIFGTVPYLVDHWYPSTYKWNPDQMDAKRIRRQGNFDSLRIYPNGKGRPFKYKKWQFHSTDQCNQCHRPDYVDSTHGRSVLGFFTAQLNRPHPDVAGINQLEQFFSQGLLVGAKPSDWNAATVPKWASISDSTASLDLRVRSYIGANCSGCHGQRGMSIGATFGINLNMDFHAMSIPMEFKNRPVAWPYGLDTVQPFFYKTNDTLNNPKHQANLAITPALVVPGYPEKSVLLFREATRNTLPGNFDPNRNQMPPMGTYQVNEAETSAIASWILQMAFPKPIIPTRLQSLGQTSPLKTPSIEGRMLRLPPELIRAGETKVTLTGLSGRLIELRRLDIGCFAIPAEISPGIYIIQVDRRSFRRYLF